MPIDLNWSGQKYQSLIGLKILGEIVKQGVENDQEMAELALFSTLSHSSPWFG